MNKQQSSEGIDVITDGFSTFVIDNESKTLSQKYQASPEKIESYPTLDPILQQAYLSCIRAEQIAGIEQAEYHRGEGFRYYNQSVEQGVLREVKGYFPRTMAGRSMGHYEIAVFPTTKALDKLVELGFVSKIRE